MAAESRASFLMSSLGLRQARAEASMDDDEYVSWGKSANNAEYANPENAQMVRVLEEEEALDDILEVPFALKHVRDVGAMMKLAVAVVGERREDLTRHPMFHPAFGAFALGFSLGLVAGHRAKQAGLRAVGKLSRKQQELCTTWGVEVATRYLALIEADGIFSKAADQQLYGIADRWRVLADERRWELYPRLAECVEEGRRAALHWVADDAADVPPYFLNALGNLVSCYPDRRFE
ncbi:MAG: hypothetical protein N2544_02605 [Burkholderiales bacterium]|nr:hypothetical protein [Burkholderiales bacterium]